MLIFSLVTAAVLMTSCNAFDSLRGDIFCNSNRTGALVLGEVAVYNFSLPNVVERVIVETCPSAVDTVVTITDVASGNITFRADDCKLAGSGNCGRKNLRERVAFSKRGLPPPALVDCVVEELVPGAENSLVPNTEYFIGVGLAPRQGAGTYNVTVLCHTASPTASPSFHPTFIPSTQPSFSPTDSPSQVPSNVPSTLPTFTPTLAPVLNPTSAPSDVPSASPSTSPSAIPTDSPSTSPSASPSSIPSQTPSFVPSDVPSNVPSFVPSNAPTLVPSTVPSSIPSFAPSSGPTDVPSNVPTTLPTSVPTQTPSSVPSYVPSALPSSVPSDAPSSGPSLAPTFAPTTSVPTDAPSNVPTQSPSTLPSRSPTGAPTMVPTRQPVRVPTSTPTGVPTLTPSSVPSLAPTGMPSDSPTAAPTSGIPCNRSRTITLGPNENNVYLIDIKDPAIQAVTLTTCQPGTNFDTTIEVLNEPLTQRYFYGDDCGDCAVGKLGETITFAVGQHVQTPVLRGCTADSGGLLRLNRTQYNIRIAGWKKSTCSPSNGTYHLSVICHTVVPQVEADPVAVIVGPTQVSSCENVILDGSLSYGNAGRALMYYWTYGPELVACLGPNVTASRVVVPASCFNNTGSAQYTVSLRVQNWQSPVTSTKSHTFIVRNNTQPVPTLSFSSGGAQTIEASASFHTTLTISPPTLCPGKTQNAANIGVEWFLVTNLTAVPAYVWSNLGWNLATVSSNVNFSRFTGRLLASSRLDLFIPATSLIENSYYIFQASVTAYGWTGTRYLGVFVKPAAPTVQTPVAVSVSLALSTPLNLNLGSMFTFVSGDSISAYTISWSCAFVNVTEACLITPNATSSATIYSVVRALLKANMNLVATLTKGANKYSGTFQISVTTVARADVSIQVIVGRTVQLNPTEKLVVAANVVPTASYKYNWTCSGSCPSSAALSTFANTLTVDGSIATLPYGSAFELRVDVTPTSGGGFNGSAKVAVTTNAGAPLQIAPQACTVRGSGGVGVGVAFQPYTIVCDNWNDPDGPLRYQFLAKDSVGRYEVVLRYYGSLNQHTFTLGRGEYTVIARVADNLGAVTQASFKVVSTYNASIVTRANEYVSQQIANIVQLSDTLNLSSTVFAAISSFNPDPLLYPAVDSAANLPTIKNVTSSLIDAILSISTTVNNSAAVFAVQASTTRCVLVNPAHVEIAKYPPLIASLNVMLTAIQSSNDIPVGSQTSLSAQVAGDIVASIGSAYAALSLLGARRRLQLTNASGQQLAEDGHTLLERTMLEGLQKKLPNEVPFRFTNEFLFAESNVLDVNFPLNVCGGDFVNFMNVSSYLAARSSSSNLVYCVFVRAFVDGYGPVTNGIKSATDVTSLSFSVGRTVSSATSRRRLQTVGSPIVVQNLPQCSPVILTLENRNSTRFTNKSVNGTLYLPRCQSYNTTSNTWSFDTCYALTTNGTHTQCVCTQLATISVITETFRPKINLVETTKARALNSPNIRERPTTLIFIVLLVFFGLILFASVPRKNDKPLLAQPRVYSVSQQLNSWEDSYDGIYWKILNTKRNFTGCIPYCHLWWLKMRMSHVIVSFVNRVPGTNFTGPQRVLCLIVNLMTMALFNAIIFGHIRYTTVSIVGMIFLSSVLGYIMKRMAQTLFSHHRPSVFLRTQVSPFQRCYACCDRDYAYDLRQIDVKQKLVELIALYDVEAQANMKFVMDDDGKETEIEYLASPSVLKVEQSHKRIMGNQRMASTSLYNEDFDADEPIGGRSSLLTSGATRTIEDEKAVEMLIELDAEVADHVADLTREELKYIVGLSEVQELNKQIKPTGKQYMLSKEQLAKLTFIQFHMLEKRYRLPNWSVWIPYICSIIFATIVFVIILMFGVNYDLGATYSIPSSIVTSIESTCSNKTLAIDIPYKSRIIYSENSNEVAFQNGLNTRTTTNAYGTLDSTAFILNTLLSWLVGIFVTGPILTFLNAIVLYHCHRRRDANLNAIDQDTEFDDDGALTVDERIDRDVGQFSAKQLITAPETILYNRDVVNLHVKGYSSLIRVSPEDRQRFRRDEEDELKDDTPNDSGNDLRAALLPKGDEAKTNDIPRPTPGSRSNQDEIELATVTSKKSNSRPQIDVENSQSIEIRDDDIANNEQATYSIPMTPSQKNLTVEFSDKPSFTDKRSGSKNSLNPFKRSQKGSQKGESLLGGQDSQGYGFAAESDEEKSPNQQIDTEGFGTLDMESIAVAKSEVDPARVLYDEFMATEWRYLDDQDTDLVTTNRWIEYFSERVSLSEDDLGKLFNEIVMNYSGGGKGKMTAKKFLTWRNGLTVERCREILDGNISTDVPRASKADRDVESTADLIRGEAHDILDALNSFDWRQLAEDDNGDVDINAFVRGFRETPLDRGEPQILLRKIFELADADHEGTLNAREYFMWRSRQNVTKIQNILESLDPAIDGAVDEEAKENEAGQVVDDESDEGEIVDLIGMDDDENGEIVQEVGDSNAENPAQVAQVVNENVSN